MNLALPFVFKLPHGQAFAVLILFCSCLVANRLKVE